MAVAFFRAVSICINYKMYSITYSCILQVEKLGFEEAESQQALAIFEVSDLSHFCREILIIDSVSVTCLYYKQSITSGVSFGNTDYSSVSFH